MPIQDPGVYETNMPRGGCSSLTGRRRTRLRIELVDLVNFWASPDLVASVRQLNPSIVLNEGSMFTDSR